MKKNSCSVLCITENVKFKLHIEYIWAQHTHEKVTTKVKRLGRLKRKLVHDQVAFFPLLAQVERDTLISFFLNNSRFHKKHWFWYTVERQPQKHLSSIQIWFLDRYKMILYRTIQFPFKKRENKQNCLFLFVYNETVQTNCTETQCRRKKKIFSLMIKLLYKIIIKSRVE